MIRPSLALFLLPLAWLLAPAPATAQVVVPNGFVHDEVVGGLNEPNSFAFLPDGRLLFTEQRTGRVRMVVNGHIAGTDPVFTVPSLSSAGYERGLQGIAVDPAWPARPFVYLFYTRTGEFLRLVRYTATGNLSNPVGENLALTTPLLLIDDVPDLTQWHNAGCLRFGPDGMLYVSLGDDDSYYCDAALRTTMRGQILRLKVDALPTGGGPQVARALLAPGDNPWAASSNANERLVFAHGMRNPWRFQVDPVTGVLYGCDVGETHFEEQNEIRAGDFLGWPWREGNFSLVRGTCPEPGGVGAQPYVAPIASFGRNTDLHAVVSAGMYRPVTGGASNWPTLYHPLLGDVFYTDYYVGDLRRLTFDGVSWNRAAAVPGQPNDSSWASGLVAAVDFLVGPDGSLWFLRQFNENFDSFTGSVNRIRFAGTVAVEGPAIGARALRAWPNPSASAVELSFRLPAAERVRLVVHDISGRRVATLLDDEAPAGESRVRWAGTGSDGRAVAAGVYFARLDRAHPADAQTVRFLRTR